MLNQIFYEFDSIVESEGLEKIKTIGDGYMAAAGIPDPRPDHALIAVRAAQRMIAALEQYNAALGFTSARPRF